MSASDVDALSIWVGDTPPAAAHRTHAVSVASLSLADRDGVYVKRAWPFAFVFFDVQLQTALVVLRPFALILFATGLHGRGYL